MRRALAVGESCAGVQRPALDAGWVGLSFGDAMKTKKQQFAEFASELVGLVPHSMWIASSAGRGELEVRHPDLGIKSFFIELVPGGEVRANMRSGFGVGRAASVAEYINEKLAREVIARRRSDEAMRVTGLRWADVGVEGSARLSSRFTPWMGSPRRESETQTYELSLRDLSAAQVEAVFDLFINKHTASGQ